MVFLLCFVLALHAFVATNVNYINKLPSTLLKSEISPYLTDQELVDLSSVNHAIRNHLEEEIHERFS